MSRVYLFICSMLLIIFAPSAANGQTARDRELAVWALEQDSGSWVFNRLDEGSYGPLVEQPGYDRPDRVYRMSYTYNGGREGWIEVYILNGNLETIRYHDNSVWSDVRTAASRYDDERNRRLNSWENCRSRASSEGLDTHWQCGFRPN